MNVDDNIQILASPHENQDNTRTQDCIYMNFITDLLTNEISAPAYRVIKTSEMIWYIHNFYTNQY